MTKRFPSRVNVSDETSTQLIETLNQTLATTLDLQLQVKQAHWNIKGPMFVSRHELFDDLAEHLRDCADDIAERAATLGGYAKGTARLASQNSKLDEYELDAVEGKFHLKALAERYGAYSKFLRQALEEAEQKKEPVTADLYTEVLRIAELDMWFIESHLNV